jgi:hypothetical protein
LHVLRVADAQRGLLWRLKMFLKEHL